MSDMKKLSLFFTAFLTAAACVCASSMAVGAFSASYSSSMTPAQRQMAITILLTVCGAGLLIIIPIVIYLTVKKKRGKEKHIDPIASQNRQKQQPKNQISLPMSDLVPRNYNEIIGAQIRRHDPDFSSVKFCDWSKNVFIRLLTSLSENDLKEMRLLATEQLLQKLNAELSGMLSGGNINLFQNIHINRCYLQLLVQNRSHEMLTVYLYGTMQSYMATGSTLEPLPNYRTDSQPFKYLITFTRKVTAHTVYVNGIQAVCCRCCGAPTENTSDVRCSYCGSPLTATDDNWLLSDVAIMRDNRPLDDRGVAMEEI